MSWRSHRLRLLACAMLLGSSAPNCSKSNDGKRVQLAEGCAVNSDCNAPYVCAFETCHEQCKSSRDCPTGARCVEGERPLHVCQLTSESACTHHSDCPPSQLCGSDGQCRDACVTARDCLADQVCVAGTCADGRELIDGKLPAVSAGSGQVCLHSSDCPGVLMCLFSRCDVECITDKDCFVSWTCVETRCHPPALDGSVTDSPISDATDAIAACVVAGDAAGDAGRGAIASASMGDGHACAVRMDGTLWCWGWNVFGQVGDGTTTTRTSAINLATLGTDTAAVSAGGGHTCDRASRRLQGGAARRTIGRRFLECAGRLCADRSGRVRNQLAQRHCGQPLTVRLADGGRRTIKPSPPGRRVDPIALAPDADVVPTSDSLRQAS